MTPTTETWRPVVGYEGYYEVSDQGRVRSVERTSLDLRGYIKRYRGRLIQGGRSPLDGRRNVHLSCDGRDVYRTVSTLVLEAFIGPRPDDSFYACHNNGDATDDRLGNLRWDTPTNNSYDRVWHGNHYQAQKDRCPFGHRLTHPNLVPSRAMKGQRNCLACARARSTANYARRMGRPVDVRGLADDHYARIMKE